MDRSGMFRFITGLFIAFQGLDYVVSCGLSSCSCFRFIWRVDRLPLLTLQCLCKVAVLLSCVRVQKHPPRSWHARSCSALQEFRRPHLIADLESTARVKHETTRPMTSPMQTTLRATPSASYHASFGTASGLSSQLAITLNPKTRGSRPAAKRWSNVVWAGILQPAL